MTILQMIAALDRMIPDAEAINVALKSMPQYSRDNRSENVWTAYSTSGAVVSRMIMLRNLLQRTHAEGHE